MKIKKTIFEQVDREYHITSAEFKKVMNIEGEIISIELYTRRSPNDVEKGVLADKDVWEIRTKETGEVK